MGFSLDGFFGWFAPQTHTVQTGDTLSGIAQQYYGDAGDFMRIYEANRDQVSDPNKIYPGQVLRLPRKK